MPNFQINNDNYIKDYHLSFRTEFEFWLEKALDNPILNKLDKDIDGEIIFDLGKLEKEINKFLQIHTLRCKLCKSKRKVCKTSNDLINIFEVFF
jgi:hypothetical protein